MPYKIEVSNSAEKYLDKLLPKTRKKILEKLIYFEQQNSPLEFAIKLSGKKNKYRFRIGQYRAVFTKRPDGKLIILIILKIAHRKEIYQ